MNITFEQKIANMLALNPKLVVGVKDERLPSSWRNVKNPLQAAKNFASRNNLTAKKVGKKQDKIESGYIAELNEAGELLATAVLSRRMTIAEVSALGWKLSKPVATKRIGKKQLELTN